MELFSFISNICTIVGAFFSLLAWLYSFKTRQILEEERKRLNKKIEVVLQNGGRSLRLPIELRRAELTRSEILGRIGMIPMKNPGSRFSIKYLSNSHFLTQINQITDNNTEMILTIPCDNSEIEQFDIN